MIKQYLLITAALSLLAGCQSPSSDAADSDGTPVPIEVSSGIHTRAYDDTWEDQDAIGIFMLNGNTPQEKASRYTTTGDGSFKPAEGQTIYFPTDGSERDFIAFYPYTDTLTDARTYNADVSRQDSQRDIDLMGSERVNGKNSENNTVHFTFTHKLVKLDIHIKPGEGLDEAALAGTTVALTAQQTKATYDAVNGGPLTVNAAETAREINLFTAQDGKHYEAIVLPAPTTEGMKLRFTLPALAGRAFEWEIKKAPASQQFEAGKKYRYTVAISRTAISVISVIAPWDDGNGQDGENGNAE